MHHEDHIHAHDGRHLPHNHNHSHESKKPIKALLAWMQYMVLHDFRHKNYAE